jgi:hypothetical protein
MNLSLQQVNSCIAALIFIIAIYASYLLIPNIESTYQGWASYFDQQSGFYPAIITFIIASIPLSFIAISYLVYSNKRKYFMLLPLVHVVLLFSSITVYGLVVVLLVWWFAGNKSKAT